MRISQIDANVTTVFPENINDKKSNKVRKTTLGQTSFKSDTKSIEKYLYSRFKMHADFRNNNLVAESVKKVSCVFSKVFGDRALPSVVEFVSFNRKFPYDYDNDYTLGLHIAKPYSENNEVLFNADQSCFKTKNKLKFNELAAKAAWFHPTGHYLQTFVHEYGHSAHYKHLYDGGNYTVMGDLRNAQIPTSFGRFLAKFNLGRYAATNMNEFMAERITKDVCKNLDRNDGFVGRTSDLEYSDIFSRKWSYRYSTPQAYLDYYTQQVWNGDVTEAKNALGKMERYLKEVELAETARVSSGGNTVSTSEGRTFVEKLFDYFTDGEGHKITKKLDERNRIKLK